MTDRTSGSNYIIKPRTNLVRNSTGYNIGGSYSLTEHLRLLMTAGSGLQSTAATNQFSYYAGLQVTF